MIFKNNTSKINIIIEYDGFKEHFTDFDNVNKFNYDSYYKEDDLYRQKILESYGYIFLRFNKFNLGKNPINSISDKLKYIIEKNINGYNEEKLITELLRDINDFQDGKLKKCLRCGNIKDIEDFFDETLSNNYGKICKTCKELEKSTSNTIKRTNLNGDIQTLRKCFECGEHKDIENFKDDKLKSGYRRICQTCNDAKEQEKNKEYIINNFHSLYDKKNILEGLIKQGGRISIKFLKSNGEYMYITNFKPKNINGESLFGYIYNGESRNYEIENIKFVKCLR